MALSRMSMTDLRERLETRHGEKAPEKWSKVELQTRLVELEGTDVLEPKQTKDTPLQLMVKEINRAARKKCYLQDYVTKTMKISITGNETIPILKVKAMTMAYQLAEPSSQDLMGFGKHAGWTYEETLLKDPKYAEWARTISMEEETNPRLRRWVRWLEQVPDVDMVLKIRAEAEDQKCATKPTEKALPSLAASSTATMEMLTQAVQELTKEVAKAREERAESSEIRRKSRAVEKGAE